MKGLADFLAAVVALLTPVYRTVLRDWFAGQALAGMLAHSRGLPPHGYRPSNPTIPWHQAISAEAYALSDAMLAAREQEQGNG